MRGTREAGSVMVLALLVTLVILGLGITVMWVSSSGMKISTNITRRQEALYAAEAGIERARAVLNATVDWTPFLKGDACTPAEAAIDPVKGRVLCNATDRLAGVNVLMTGFTGPSDPLQSKMTYTVYIRNDWNVECNSTATSITAVDCDADGSPEASPYTLTNTDNNARVVLRAEGIGRDGLSFAAVEVVVSRGSGFTAGNQYSQAGLNAQGTSSMTGKLQ